MYKPNKFCEQWNIHTYIHTYIHAYIHTHTHTHTHIYSKFPGFAVSVLR